MMGRGRVRCCLVSVVIVLTLIAAHYIIDTMGSFAMWTLCVRLASLLGRESFITNIIESLFVALEPIFSIAGQQS